MRFLLLCLTAVVFVSSVQAQSTGETVDWINSKLTAFPLRLGDGTVAEQEVNIESCTLMYKISLADGFIDKGEIFMIPLRNVTAVDLTFEQGVRGMHDVAVSTSGTAGPMIHYYGPLPRGRNLRIMYITVGGDSQNVPSRMVSAIESLVQGCGGNTSEPF